ncbi:unnamed protein product [Ceratitis capitata]|uniref:(Mediterranean fruit fly) hypothetical protein n=1 Tax=Ceratitis capitata TaxID=7213 RepID=A0A811VJ31_CERCA|nr:unnamed protein product [Ceratitis capitata]
MADENILSSPRKLNSSIHRSRLRRKHKRLNATFTKTPEPPPDNATTFHKIKNTTCEEDLSCTLLVMYDSEEDDMEDECRVADNVLAKVKENYDPFAEQRLLVLADRLAAPSRRSHNFTATQGFQPCHNFLNQFTEICPEKIMQCIVRKKLKWKLLIRSYCKYALRLNRAPQTLLLILNKNRRK